MSLVTVQLPRVLAELTGCAPRVDVEGATVGEALEELIRREPALALHLYDDTRALRRHILCFCNAVQERDRARLDRALAPGDVLTIVNSVAGG